jgi:predicted AlkP superfamily pyrophosphatase or phosphodiesterase
VKNKNAILISSAFGLVAIASSLLVTRAQTASIGGNAIKRVLLISVDGLHASDLSMLVKLKPESSLAALSKTGLTYSNASSAMPSDSFPGLLALITGGSPKSTGVYYDNSYDRSLSAPGTKCETKGTEVVFDESADVNPDLLMTTLDENKLPRDGAKGCTPVYPSRFLRVNTIFEVAKAAGLRTAWSDKHPAYDLVNGPSGKGVDDLYVPEINNADAPTKSVTKTEAYDDTKVQAIINQIKGLDSAGKTSSVPTIFGMNFQAVSVAQKLAGNGYTDANGTPSAGLLDAITHTDSSLGKIVGALNQAKLLESTLIVVTAKHAQSPIDPSKRRLIDEATIPGIVEGVSKGVLAKATQDDVGLLWLNDAGKTAAVVAALEKNKAVAGIDKILSGDAIKALYGDPSKDSRTPDIVVLPLEGVIYAGAKATKIAEHGGFSKNDTNVAMLVSNPGLKAVTSSANVTTTQVAPSILKALGLEPEKLDAVKLEKTVVLPGLFN